jgi:hypothetical protein
MDDSSEKSEQKIPFSNALLVSINSIAQGLGNGGLRREYSRV